MTKYHWNPKYWNINGQVFRAKKLHTALYDYGHRIDHVDLVDIKVRPATYNDYTFWSYCSYCHERTLFRDCLEEGEHIDRCTKCGLSNHETIEKRDD